VQGNATSGRFEFANGTVSVGGSSGWWTSGRWGNVTVADGAARLQGLVASLVQPTHLPLGVDESNRTGGVSLTVWEALSVGHLPIAVTDPMAVRNGTLAAQSVFVAISPAVDPASPAVLLSRATSENLTQAFLRCHPASRAPTDPTLAMTWNGTLVWSLHATWDNGPGFDYQGGNGETLHCDPGGGNVWAQVDAVTGGLVGWGDDERPGYASGCM